MKTSLLLGASTLALVNASMTVPDLSDLELNITDIYTPWDENCDSFVIDDVKPEAEKCETYLATTKEMQCIGFAAELVNSLGMTDGNEAGLPGDLGKQLESLEELVKSQDDVTALLTSVFTEVADDIFNLGKNKILTDFILAKLPCLGIELPEEFGPFITLITTASSAEALKTQLLSLGVPVLAPLLWGLLNTPADTTTRTLAAMVEEAAEAQQTNNYLLTKECLGVDIPETPVFTTGINIAKFEALFTGEPAKADECTICADNPAAGGAEGGIKPEEILMKQFNAVIASGGSLKALGTDLSGLITSLYHGVVKFAGAKNADAKKTLCSIFEEGNTDQLITKEQMKMGQECLAQTLNPEGLLMATVYNGEKFPAACKTLNEMICDNNPIFPLLEADVYEDGVLATFFGQDYIGFLQAFDNMEEKAKSVCAPPKEEPEGESGASATVVSVSALIASAYAALRM